MQGTKNPDMMEASGKKKKASEEQIKKASASLAFAAKRLNPEQIRSYSELAPDLALRYAAEYLDQETFNRCILRSPGEALTPQNNKRLTPEQKTYCIENAPAAALQYFSSQLSEDEFDRCACKTPATALFYNIGRFTRRTVRLILSENSGIQNFIFETRKRENLKQTGFLKILGWIQFEGVQARELAESLKKEEKKNLLDTLLEQVAQQAAIHI